MGIRLDQNHILNVGWGATISTFAAFGLFFLFVGFFDIEIGLPLRLVFAAIQVAIIGYNCDINGKPAFDIVFEKNPVKF